MRLKLDCGTEVLLQRRHTGELRVCWCSDWTALDETKHPAFYRKDYRAATFGHVDVMCNANLLDGEVIG